MGSCGWNLNLCEPCVIIRAHISRINSCPGVSNLISSSEKHIYTDRKNSTGFNGGTIT